MDHEHPREFQDAQTYALIGAAMEVHTVMGCGFHERVYREAFMLEMSSRRVPFEREVSFPITYKGQIVPVSYRADFVCYGQVLVELKALSNIGPIEHAQVINYLRASNLQRAMLLNFGARSLQYQRIVYGLTEDPRSGRPANPRL